jgi:hypothetical protein
MKQEAWSWEPFKKDSSLSASKVHSAVRIRLEAQQKCEVFHDDIENATRNALTNKQVCLYNSSSSTACMHGSYSTSARSVKNQLPFCQEFPWFPAKTSRVLLPNHNSLAEANKVHGLRDVKQAEIQWLTRMHA